MVKGVRFVDLTDEGDPPTLAERHAAEGADEIVFLDISAAPEARGTLLDIVERTARRVFVPVTVGGGVRTADEMRAVRPRASNLRECRQGQPPAGPSPTDGARARCHRSLAAGAGRPCR